MTSHMETCPLCGDFIQAPCVACGTVYADDLPLDEVIILLDEELEDTLI